ncbi:hypothetical protein [Mastigocoleus sp. MO_188.B34]|uniref:hypothetical protein n=1 Tax=Mastigocoleus sp. MO_188.B34 TaxID=3036635 RepID=UPI0026206320|nr:hypothetical protein [Mastigocoleus sp. MO_188.B34]MDJ0696921.1 hypothetical protein [Mastigocoleus sp. MO_188.B34]
MSDIRQPTNNLDEIYKKSEEVKPSFQKLIQEIAIKTGGQTKFAPLKGRKRTEEKIQADYGGDASQVKDVLRASIIYEKFEQVELGLKELQQEGKIVALKDRFKNPTESGYRDILLNVETENGIVAEIQLHLGSILQAKKQGHALYKQQREIEAKSRIENRPLTKEERLQYDSLVEKQRLLYDSAFIRASQNVQIDETLAQAIDFIVNEFGEVQEDGSITFSSENYNFLKVNDSITVERKSDGAEILKDGRFTPNASDEDLENMEKVKSIAEEYADELADSQQQQQNRGMSR